MYVEAKKAIYVALEALLLFWLGGSKILEYMGYHRNKYDWCFMKKIVNDKQCTIPWQIDNLKMLHIDYNIFSGVLSYVDAKYGKIEKMIITQDKVHKWLRMTIDYSFPGKLIFSVVKYIVNILDEIPEDMRR